MAHNNNNGTAIAPEENLSAFEIAEKKRYEKLAASPVSTGKKYPSLNLDGTTHKEILGL